MTETSGQDGVAAIIPCHNYGRFLAEALDSLRGQIVAPAEIIVVDDASTDNTADVCAQYGVRRLAVDVRNIHKARAAGFAATSAPWVTFFDADDLLPPDYIAEGTKLFAPGVGIVYSDCQNFGLRTERLDFKAGDISQRNYIHAASLARRVALESARVFETPIPACTLEDWYIWRQLLADGWRAVKSPAVHQYRRHGEGHMVYLTTRPHYEVAGLALEHVTIAILLSGRRQWWPRMADWLERQAWPTDQTHILIVDTSGDEAFGRDVRQWLAGCRYAQTQYVAMSVGDAGLADANRHREEVYRGVQRAMPRIYNGIRRRVATPYALIVEDDILPPVDAVDSLMRGMEQDTVSVSGAYRSRCQPGYVAWDRDGRSIASAGSGVQVVGGTGFGCILLRSSVFTKTVLHHGGRVGDYDPNFFDDISCGGWVAKLDWSVRCDHDGDGEGHPGRDGMPKWKRFGDCGNGVYVGSWWSCESLPRQGRATIHVQSPGVPCRCTHRLPGDLEIEALEQRPLGRAVIEQIVDFAVATPSIFVHCNAGQCRGPTVAALCLMARGQTAAVAQQAVRAAMLTQYAAPVEPAFFQNVFDEIEVVMRTRRRLQVITPAVPAPPELPRTERPPVRQLHVPACASGTKLAALTTVFTAHPASRPRKNFDKFVVGMERAGIPLFVIECAIGDAPFWVPDRAGLVRVRAAEPGWHKERLLNILERCVPPRFTKLAWLDADILFDDEDWAGRAEHMLDEHATLQLFTTAAWLHPDNEVAVEWRGLAASYADYDGDERPVQAHPGFAWAMRRDLWRAQGGLLDTLGTMAADSVMSASWCGRLPTYWPEAAVGSAPTWCARARRLVRGSVGALPGRVRHLWHGPYARRQYNRLWRVLSAAGWRGAAELLHDPRDPFHTPYRLARPDVFAPIYADFFAKRDEDARLDKDDIHAPELL